MSIIASDDTEVYSILHSEEQFHDGHEDCLYHNIKQSQKYELKDESLESGIVDAFVT